MTPSQRIRLELTQLAGELRVAGLTDYERRAYAVRGMLDEALSSSDGDVLSHLESHILEARRYVPSGSPGDVRLDDALRLIRRTRGER